MYFLNSTKLDHSQNLFFYFRATCFETTYSLRAKFKARENNGISLDLNAILGIPPFVKILFIVTRAVAILAKSS